MHIIIYALELRNFHSTLWCSKFGNTSREKMYTLITLCYHQGYTLGANIGGALAALIPGLDLGIEVLFSAWIHIKVHSYEVMICMKVLKGTVQKRDLELADRMPSGTLDVNPEEYKRVM